jgi:hypothetical protein
MNNPALENHRNQGMSYKLVQAVEALLKSEPESYCRGVSPAAGFSFNRDTLREGLRAIETTLPGEDEGVYAVVKILEEQLGNDQGLLRADEFYEVFSMVLWEFRKGVDFSKLNFAEASAKQSSIFRTGIDPLQHESCDMFTRLEGPLVGRSRFYYQEVETALPRLMKAALPQAEAEDFVAGVLYEHYNCIGIQEVVDRPLSDVYPYEEAIGIVELRQKLSLLRSSVSGETEDFYVLGDTIAREISPAAVAGTPIDIKLKDLKRYYTTARRPEELEVVKALVDDLLENHSVNFSNLLQALNSVEDYFPDIATEVVVLAHELAENLEYDQVYHRQIDTRGEVYASVFYYIAAVALEHAGQEQERFAGSVLYGISEQAQAGLMSRLPKIALMVGGEKYKGQVEEMLSSEARIAQYHELAKNLRKHLLLKAKA